MESNKPISSVLRKVGAFLSHDRLMTMLIHILGISIIIVIPEIIIRQFSPDRHNADTAFRAEWTMYVKALIYAAVFYLNYLVIFDWSLRRRRRPALWFLGANILLISVAAILIFSTLAICDHPGDHRRHGGPDFGKKEQCEQPIVPPGHYRHPEGEKGGEKHKRRHIIREPLPFMVRDAVALILLVGLAAAVKLGLRSTQLRRKAAATEAMQRRTELDNLKSQLNPHFLFNTLNTIYALIAIDGPKAQNAVYELSKMLRYMLYNSSATVALSRECELVTSYVDLMKLRLPDSTRIEMKLDPGADAGMQVAPLILLTLVENFFKHGDLSAPAPPVPSITLTTNGGMIRFVTVNACRQEPTEKQRGGGIGLVNLKRRLLLIYGQRATLSTKLSPDGRIFEAVMTIDLTASPAPDNADPHSDGGNVTP